MSNNKTEEMKKEGCFDPECITDIQDKLLSNNYALKAFAALLASSDLHDFANQYPADIYRDNNYNAEALRLGLSQIIDLYLEHQERIIDEYVDQYHKSDTCLVRWVKSAIDMVERGAFTTKDAAINKLRETIDDLDIVIKRGGELKEKAEELKGYCMTYLKPMTGKTKENG